MTQAPPDARVGNAYRPDIAIASAALNEMLNRNGMPAPMTLLQSPDEVRSIASMGKGQLGSIANKLVADTIAQFNGDVQRGINTGSGFQPYVLEAPAKVIFPVRAPFAKLAPRMVGKGTDIEHWKSILSVFNQGGPFSQAHLGGATDGGTSIDSPVYVVNPYQSYYQTIAEYNFITFQAQWRSRALEGDMLARRKIELLYALKLQEENWLLNGAAKCWPPAPGLLTTAATGGTFAAGTYWIVITATNGSGETLALGGATATAKSIITTGATSTITVTFSGVPWATGYNVYIGTGATQPANSAMWMTAAANYVGAAKPVQPTDYIGSMSITATITVNSTSGTAYSTTVTNGNTATVNGPMFDGAMSLCYLNPNGGGNISVGEQGMTSMIVQPSATSGLLALSDIQLLLRKMLSQAGADPTHLFVSPVEAVTIDNLVGTSSNYRIVADPTNPNSVGNLTAGQKVRKILNQATGTELDVVTCPYLPQGSIMAGSYEIPFPVSGVTDPPFRVMVNQDYLAVDYPPTPANPQQYGFGYFVDETLVNQYSGGWGVLSGIQPAVGV